MQQIDRSWAALQSALSRLTPSQLIDPKDAAGWSVKDHVLHLAAWERSVVFLLQGRPRHAGLGVSESTYLNETFETINAAIFANTSSATPEDALAQLRDVHMQMMALLQPLTDDDLSKPYRAYLPDEEREGDGPPVVDVIYSNTAEHFTEHLHWINALSENRF
jgi:hypothetical protein